MFESFRCLAIVNINDELKKRKIKLIHYIRNSPNYQQKILEWSIRVLASQQSLKAFNE